MDVRKDLKLNFDLDKISQKLIKQLIFKVILIAL